MGLGRVGRYRILAKLGEGGMARVLLTMAEGSHAFYKLLVIKELRDELAHDPEFLSMFLDEARIAARLNHPNIVQTYEVGSEGDRYFMAMEYLEGQPLSAVYRRVGRKNLPLEIQLRILADVLAGLHYAHQLADFDGMPLDVVHRDVSPQNVFVTYDGHVKLVDFGIAKAAGASATTRKGTMKGKLSYIAPEQCRCEPVDGRADLFAVGVMLWEALAGRRLVQREDEGSVLARRMSGQDPPIRAVLPDVPLDLSMVCDKAMASDPTNRFQTAHQFREALEHCLAKSSFRVGTNEVAQLVADAFADERVRIRGIIEEQVRNVDRSGELISLELHPNRLRQTWDALPRVAATPSQGLPSSPPASNLTQLTQELSEHPRSRPAASALVAAVASVAALAVFGLGFYLVRGRTAGIVGEQAPAVAASRASDAAGATLDLLVKYPDGARLKLDGGYVDGHPFTARVPRDGSIHKLDIEQDGFTTATRTITFDRDIDVSVELVPASLPVATAEPRPAGRGSWRPPPKPIASAKVDDEDGLATKRPPASVSIDEDNPYKRKK